VTYDVLTNWRLRLRRKAVNASVPAPVEKVDRQAMA